MARQSAKPHTTHRMSKWESEVRAPAGTPRFYSVRSCKRCGEEEMKHAAGHFMGRLEKECSAQPSPRAPQVLGKVAK